MSLILKGKRILQIAYSFCHPPNSRPAKLGLKPCNPMNSNNDHPTFEGIAALARSYWEEEGRPDGKGEEHWLRAEEVLR